MKVRAILIAMLLAVSAAAAGTEMQDARLATEFKLIGRWAVDCNAPPSSANPTQIFILGGDGSIRRRLMMDTAGNDSMSSIGMLQAIGDDKLNAIWVQDRGDVITSTTLLFSGRRHRAWESSPVDKPYLIHNGVIVATGQKTLWFTKCD